MWSHPGLFSTVTISLLPKRKIDKDMFSLVSLLQQMTVSLVIII